MLFDEPAPLNPPSRPAVRRDRSPRMSTPRATTWGPHTVTGAPSFWHDDAASRRRPRQPVSGQRSKTRLSTATPQAPRSSSGAAALLYQTRSTGGPAMPSPRPASGSVTRTNHSVRHASGLMERLVVPQHRVTAAPVDASSWYTSSYFQVDAAPSRIFAETARKPLRKQTASPVGRKEDRTAAIGAAAATAAAPKATVTATAAEPPFAPGAQTQPLRKAPPEVDVARSPRRPLTATSRHRAASGVVCHLALDSSLHSVRRQLSDISTLVTLACDAVRTMGVDTPSTIAQMSGPSRPMSAQIPRGGRGHTTTMAPLLASAHIALVDTVRSLQTVVATEVASVATLLRPGVVWLRAPVSSSCVDGVPTASSATTVGSLAGGGHCPTSTGSDADGDDRLARVGAVSMAFAVASGLQSVMACSPKNAYALSFFEKTVSGLKRLVDDPATHPTLECLLMRMHPQQQGDGVWSQLTNVATSSVANGPPPDLKVATERLLDMLADLAAQSLNPGPRHDTTTATTQRAATTASISAASPLAMVLRSTRRLATVIAHRRIASLQLLRILWRHRVAEIAAFEQPAAATRRRRRRRGRAGSTTRGGRGGSCGRVAADGRHPPPSGQLVGEQCSHERFPPAASPTDGSDRRRCWCDDVQSVSPPPRRQSSLREGPRSATRHPVGRVRGLGGPRLAAGRGGRIV